MDITLRRVGRTVAASSSDGQPLPPQVVQWLQDKLTYYERKFDYSTVGDTGSPLRLIERQLYQIHPRSGHIVFPIGMRARVAMGLTGLGHRVTLQGKSLAEAKPAVYEPNWDGLLSNFEIYPGQDECLASIHAAAADGGIISACTGAGKSVIIRMLCCLYNKARIHIVTKSSTLADEIYGDVLSVIPDAGFVGAGKKNLQRVTVFIADSLHHGEGNADIVLADELHELLAPKYSRLLGMYGEARMYGFSATATGRQDGRDVVGEAIFGPTLYTQTYQEAEAAGRVVPITVEWLKIPQGPSLGGIRFPTIKEKIGVWRNDFRNRVVAARAAQIPPDEQVMVMVKTIDHAVQLRQHLPDYTLCYAADGMDRERVDGYIKKGLLPHDEPLMTRQRLSDLRAGFADGSLKKVISNYVWSTGVNFRRLGVLIRADAAASTIRDGQIPGRICRRVAGVKESALLIDCWDEWDSTLLNRARSRHRNYKSRGWSQIFT